MHQAAPDIATDDLAFICDEPTCELSRGPLGLTAAEIQARVHQLRAKSPPEPPADEPDADADADADDSDADDSDELDDPPDAPPDAPPDLSATDPLGDGAPCPLCHTATPPRRGKLLAIAHRGTYARVLAATTGIFGLQFWQLIESRSTTSTNRELDALRRATGASTTSGYVTGRKSITVTVLKELPFDGHLLRYGNRDADATEYIIVPAEKKGHKPKRQKVQGEAKYDLDHAPPGPAARQNPAYVRELQEDLIWLGYLSTSRGTPVSGKFDVYTLGAVLGFKQDLVELYGIATSPTRQTVEPGSVRAGAGEFTKAIWYQPKFVSPVRIMLNWRDALLRKRKRPKKDKKARSDVRLVAEVNGAALLMQTLVKTTGRLVKATKPKEFQTHLGSFETHRTDLDFVIDHWPHLAPLEQVDRPFMPFAPKQASKTVATLAAAPAGKQPKHPDADALTKDPVWSSDEYNARPINKKYFLVDLNQLLSTLGHAIDDVAEVRAVMATITAPAEAAAAWTAARTAADATLALLDRLLALIEFWVLDSPTQMKAWLDHIVDMGTVDRPTAVYLKALREYGKIGPHRRPAYQLKPMTADDDFASPDVGATYLRDTCTGRPNNASGQKGNTVPEIVALQFFGNESGLVFTGKVDPFHTRAEHKKLRHAVMGIDTNAHRRGSFDAVFHAGGDWYTSRGWGVGQATDTDIVLDGVQLRRGLPVLPPDAEAIIHPRPFIDRFASVNDAIDRKILPKYDRTDRRDCTFGANVQGGNYYDCRNCLKRFYDETMTGTGEYGEGGVFVPVSKALVGSVRKASGFFIDFERYTPYARGKDGAEDPTRRELYARYFALDLPEPDPDVVAVLRRSNGATTIEDAVIAVTKGRPLDKKALKAERKALTGKVLDHVEKRSQLPCSWLLVRMRYAGTGEQAFSSLFDLLKVVGDLDTKNTVLIKHIEEASELRRK